MKDPLNTMRKLIEEGLIKETFVHHKIIEDYGVPARLLEPAREAAFSLLRTMNATWRAPCPYCGKEIFIGDGISGNYGVKWGHPKCVTASFETGTLLASKANADRRPKALTKRLRKSKQPERTQSLLVAKERDHLAEIPDYGDKTKEMDINTCKFPKETVKILVEVCRAWPSQLVDPCPYFAPIHITTLHLPRDLRLNIKMLLMDMKNESLKSKTEKIQRMWDVTWEKYIKQWFERYKRTMVQAPFCPIHQLSHDPKDHVQLHVQTLDGIVHRKELLWYCPVSEK